MRAEEFLTEKIVGHLHHNGIDIDVNDHAFDQAKERNVPYTLIDPALKKIGAIKDQIAQIEPGQQFWVYDPKSEVAIGMRRLDDRTGGNMKLVLNTLLGWHPGESVNPVLELPR